MAKRASLGLMLLTIVALLMVSCGGGAGGDAAAGRTIYEERCAACHGAKGMGDGPGALALEPKPADFTNADFWAKRTDAELLDIIADGKGPMPAWKSILSDQDQKNVLEYIGITFKPK